MSVNNTEHYLRQLQALLPLGDAWTREEEATLTQFLYALAEEFARIDGRVEDLVVNENDPRTTIEMLSDWERAFGLPDACTEAADTVAERHNVLHEKVTRIGDQSRQYFIDVAARVGYIITITEFDTFNAGDHAGDTVNGQNWRFAWRVNAPEETITEFKAGLSVAGDPLRDWGNEILECVITKLKPAHTLVQFAYGG